ncbi:hypothetical protein [Paenibacillus sp. 1P07SE]|uniref:hypothetical protein n=1 Tax=Paenibacillus sp. 1P07SE TaxID=3132209 RepID=UPI0039A6466E
MKVKLDPLAVDSKDLSWLCVKPMLLAVQGKDLATKTDMYNQLSEGQKGLYLFYSYHNHTKTLEEFYWFSAYHINELKSWDKIKNGLKYFKEMNLPELLEEIEMLIDDAVSPTDLENDKKLSKDVKNLYEKYNLYSEICINRLNEWVKANRTEFFGID